MEKPDLRWKGETDDTQTRGQTAMCYRQVFPLYESTYPEYPTDVISKTWTLA